MTTLTNFLHSTFLSTASTSGSNTVTEKPIWVLNGHLSQKINVIKEYIVDNCVSGDPNKKDLKDRVLVRVDFGIGVWRELRQGWKKVDQIDGLQVWVKENTGYIVVCVRASLRSNISKCLSLVLDMLSKIPNKLATYMESTTQKTALSLLIQNLQIISSCSSSQQTCSPNLQSFITHIPSLPSCYKQTTIITYSLPSLLLPEHVFVLQRISTCLTHVLDFNKVQDKWTVRATVRRYTGYSKEELYTIHITKTGRYKVQKYQQKTQQQETQVQKNMVRQLGFVVKKGNKQKQNERSIKEMIYPHLRVQNQTNQSGKQCCNKTECKTGCLCSTVRPEDQGLIILDDQQEDDDDIDV